MKKDNILPQRLKIARNKIGWTQEQVADKLSISIGTLSGYERGYRSPNPEMLIKLSGLYMVSLDWLAGSTDDPSPPKKLDTPDYDAIVLAAPNLPEAVVISSALEAKYKLPKSWLYTVWEKATKKYGVPEPAKDSELAAHHNGLPGTGIFEEKE